MKLKRVFHNPAPKAFAGQNFMTPYLEAYYQGYFCYELTSGRGFQGEPIFGLTVSTDKETRHDIYSGVHHSREEAIARMEQIEEDEEEANS